MRGKRAIMRMAVFAGEILLKNGAEIYRVQDTITRILDSFHIENYSIYVISNAIFLTMNEDSETGSFAVRHVPIGQIHLGRIESVNNLSRRLAREADPTKVDEYERALRDYARLPFFPLWLQMLACGIGSGCFCYLYGGSLPDCLAACANGLLLQLFLRLYAKKKASRYMPAILGSALVSCLTLLLSAVFPSLGMDNIIIGSIIPLVPGVSLTTAIRDFFNGDYVSGNIHLTDALLTGICIAAGVGTALYLWSSPGGLP